MNLDTAELVGPSEVSALLGVQPTTVYQWVIRGVVPEPVAIVSRTRLWRRQDILTWAEATGRA